MVIAVTGAAGMLGSAVVTRLRSDGVAVAGVDLREPPAEVADSGYRHLIGDVRDPSVLAAAFAGADAVVHCAAALPSYPADQIRSIVVEGSRTVLDAARSAKVPRLVYISSTAVYGLPRQVPTPEHHPYAPVDSYSTAKADAERLAVSYRDDDLILTVLRPKTFLGPGRMGLFAMLFQWAHEGRNFPVLGDGGVRIQMLHVADLVDAVVTALHAPADTANDTYNIGAAEFGTLRDDFQAVLDAAGHGKRVVALPARPARAALGLLERTGLSPVYGRLLHKLMADSYVDIGRAGRRLGFTPRYSNQDAVLETFRWWRARWSGPAVAASNGRTSRDPWRQGVLGAAKVFF
ncbi:NAD-dependent epimerase/dehydratase family protein [Solwaraspora sp. WMMD406]|uniref:NAD-dependent epimerase/dehydratase family protein n=1 Tax=Solwaraspora sp. WMMD406 TaxID=3016095 RepID=UPI0024159BD5|nr:NAD-dependent epimerase/dehydratase family protein [Solwaraspora sp. WMMD406]MDG4766358.1 NAD-dependent epimerase/dehydratase family protein [Solwaraspora sp. WMMD406]